MLTVTILTNGRAQHLRLLAYCLVLAHIAYNIYPTTRRLLYMVRRHRQYKSSLSLWYAGELRASAAIAAVQVHVPSNCLIEVTSDDDVAACEVAYYCFPRPVIQHWSSISAGTNNARFLLRPSAPHRWELILYSNR